MFTFQILYHNSEYFITLSLSLFCLSILGSEVCVYMTLKQLMFRRQAVFIRIIRLSNKMLFTNECKMHTCRKIESLLFQYHTTRTNKRRDSILSATYAASSKTAHLRQIMCVCVRSYRHLLRFVSENT